MARAFSRARRAPLVVAPKRSSVWIGTDVQSAAIGGASIALLASLNAAALALRPFTIVRSHYEIVWQSDQVVASESPQGAVGQIVVSDQAVASGAGAIPDPLGNVDASWYLWQALIDTFVFVTGTGWAGGAAAASRYSVDSKAMRKVGINDDIALVAENSTGAAIGAIISVTGRFLVKLH